MKGRLLPGVGGIRRLGVIARVLVRHGMGEVAERLFSRRTGAAKEPGDAAFRFRPPSPRRIRLALEELGPSFVKLGQLMSTRADILPAEYIEELEKLQDRVPPVPFPEIRQVIEQELKRPLAESFRELSPESVAAASVGQVHLGTLHTGEPVAVKVIRPGIRKQIREDIRLMYYLAARIERAFEVTRVLGLSTAVEEFERVIFRELDMLIEAGSIEKFASNFRHIDEIYLPRVYWDHTTKSVLVMERIDGIKVDQVDEIRAHGIDPKEVALIGLRSLSRQLMEFGFFHADPHPGNTIVMYDGRVSLVDFGITGYLDEEAMTHIAHLFLGYAEHDYDMVIRALREAGVVDEERIDLKAFREDLKDASEPFYGRSLRTISVMDVYEQVMRLLFKYHIRLPRNLLLLLKTFIQTEALGKILGSDASLLEITRPYAKRLLQRAHDPRRALGHLDRDLRSGLGELRSAARFLHDIVRQTARGKQRIQVWHDGFPHLDTQLERGVNRLTVGLIIAASVVAASLVLNSGQEILALQVNLFGWGAVPLTALFGLIGYVIATVLGLWLILAIFRSGKL